MPQVFCFRNVQGKKENWYCVFEKELPKIEDYSPTGKDTYPENAYQKRKLFSKRNTLGNKF